MLDKNHAMHFNIRTPAVTYGNGTYQGLGLIIDYILDCTSNSTGERQGICP